MASFSAGDGTPLFLHEFPAPSDPRAWILVVHGYAEHGGRYDHVAKALSAKGIAMVAPDLRGHGRSAGVRGHVNRFDDYHYDLGAALSEVRSRANKKPIFLFAHSMGALASMHWLLKGAGKDVRGLVMSSPYLGLALEVPEVLKLLGRAMSGLIPTFSRPAPIRGVDVARDPEFIAAHGRDPMNHGVATARWFTEASKAMEHVKRDAGLLTLPTLLLYAGHDAVADARETERLATSLRMSDKTIRRFDAAHHELVHEPPSEREEVFEAISTWILARAG
ncbi:MAG: lysophospholipase [Deltaproteobacteria bacterium]|nr:lysophospholipase [Deltaproteobacteria bacterium]